jgi:Tol biopolymer transport system component
MLRLILKFSVLLFLTFAILAAVAVTVDNHQPPMLALHFEAAQNDIVLWDTTHALTLPISFSINHEVRPNWSNDGRYVTYFRWDRNLENGVNFVPNLYIMRADGSEMRQLVNTGSVWSSEATLVRGAVRWSLDSSRIAFYHRVEGRVFLHLLLPDGTELWRRNINIGEDNILIWSGDGTRLYRFGRSENELRAFALALTPDADFELLHIWQDTRSSMANIQPSPLGRYVLLYDTHIGRIDLFDIDTLTHQPIVTGESLARINPHWSPDGTAIAYYKPLTNSVIIIDRTGQELLEVVNPIRGDEIDQIVLSNAPYTVVVEMLNHRCVLRQNAANCINLFGIRTSNNAMRPTQNR